MDDGWDHCNQCREKPMYKALEPREAEDQTKLFVGTTCTLCGHPYMKMRSDSWVPWPSFMAISFALAIAYMCHQAGK